MDGLQVWALWLKGAQVVTDSNKDKISLPWNMHVVIFQNWCVSMSGGRRAASNSMYVCPVKGSSMDRQWCCPTLSGSPPLSIYVAFNRNTATFPASKKPTKGWADTVCTILCIIYCFILFFCYETLKACGGLKFTHDISLSSIFLSMRVSPSSYITSVSSYILHTINMTLDARSWDPCHWVEWIELMRLSEGIALNINW